MTVKGVKETRKAWGDRLRRREEETLRRGRLGRLRLRKEGVLGGDVVGALLRRRPLRGGASGGGDRHGAGRALVVQPVRDERPRAARTPDAPLVDVVDATSCWW